MNHPLMGSNVHVKRFFTISLTMMLVFRFGYYLMNNGFVDNQLIDESTRIGVDITEKIRRTQEELDEYVMEKNKLFYYFLEKGMNCFEYYKL